MSVVFSRSLCLNSALVRCVLSFLSALLPPFFRIPQASPLHLASRTRPVSSNISLFLLSRYRKTFILSKHKLTPLPVSLPTSHRCSLLCFNNLAVSPSSPSQDRKPSEPVRTATAPLTLLPERLHTGKGRVRSSSRTWG